jgi:hypothetical protein
VKKFWVLCGLMTILGVGSYLRLTHLDSGTMGADVMEYYKICQSGVAPGELLVHSPQYLGKLPPFWFAAHNWFLQTFRLDVNFGTARLPDVMAGILTILVAFGAGCAAKDRRVGLLVALFVALQPLHVQMSRECYFYVPIVLGCFLALWALMRLTNRMDSHAAPDTVFYVLSIPAFLLLTHVQISAWSFAIVLAVALYSILIPGAMRHRISWWHVVALTGAFFLVGLPTLLSEWGMRDVIGVMFGQSKDEWENVFGTQDKKLWVTAWHMVSAYLVGRGGLRTGASALLLVAGIVAFAMGWKKERKLRVFGWFALGTVGLLALLHSQSIFPAENRHYSSIFPILALGISLGLVRLGDAAVGAMKRPSWKDGIPLGAFSLLIVALNGWPAWLASQVEAPYPYRMVSEWANTHLPPGTPVLCDRWFTPWNEFRMNPSTNVTYTFTIPNEPPQVYTGSRWRETAKEFFAINPRAAFFESKEYWARLGPWTWPQTQFANKQEFVDAAALRLDAMGLFYRAWSLDYPREWVPLTIYYNTEEDLVLQARKAGEHWLCLFGTGWEYTKTQDYRDWYVLEDSATLWMYNLTAEPIGVYLNLVGTAIQAPVTVTAFAGPNCVFQPNQIQANPLGPVPLNPGRNEIRLRNLTKSTPPAVLLVQRISAAETNAAPTLNR